MNENLIEWYDERKSKKVVTTVEEYLKYVSAETRRLIELSEQQITENNRIRAEGRDPTKIALIGFR